MSTDGGPFRFVGSYPCHTLRAMSDAQQDQKPAGTVDELQAEVTELRAENQRLSRENARLKQELNRAQFGARRR